ncbi:MAG: ferrous iron transport protein B [Kiritimatiellae bacterium]|nr:ferrous iron transport protein B [Kiritimatiellia bacterium]
MSGKEKSRLYVAVAGQPNCGKSTLFNAVTGSTARVGNYPGISVDRTEGEARLPDGTKMHLVDLPGTYSLTAYSQDEVIARNVILKEKPDVVINLLDATSLERSLYLTLQTMEIGARVVVGLNMMDEVKKRHIQIDSAQLAKLLGVPVIECCARRGIGGRELLEAAQKSAGTRESCPAPLHISYGPDLDPVLESLEKRINEAGFLTDRYPARWLAIKYLEEDEVLLQEGRRAGPLGEELERCVAEVSDMLRKTRNTYPEAVIADYRYGFINGLMRQGVITREDDLRFNHSDKIDALVTHRLIGPLIMCAILYAMFYITFTLGAYPQGWVEDAFGWLGGTVESLLPDGLLRSMIVNGAIDGVGAVMGFTPLILIMFLMLVFLEDLGYMGRVAYMLDRILHTFGLHGASVMPFIISGGLPGGCAVPGVMAARSLRSKRERLATIFTAPFMVCGAKTTAFILLTAAFFPENPTRAMFVIVLLAWGFALITAWLLRHTVIKGPSTPFIMELPPYRLPTLLGVLIHTWDRVWQYIKKAGTVILAASILMWALITFPQLPAEQTAHYETLRRAAQTEATQHLATNAGAEEKVSATLEKRLIEIADAESQATLQHTAAGRIGRFLEPVTRYAGFSWQANIALIGAFTAKEVFVSTMATVYSMGSTVEDEESPALSARLAADPAYTRPAVYSLIVFLLLYAPCLVTVAAIIRETGWNWGLFTLYGSLAYSFAIAVLVYQVSRLFY